MKSPCITCERALLDKNECSLGCEQRHEYCKSLGISSTWEIRPAPQIKLVAQPPYDWHAPRGMRSKGGRLEKATALMKESKGNGEICRMTGMNKATVAKLRRILEVQNGGPFLCGCGRVVTHQGACSYKRQKKRSMDD